MITFHPDYTDNKDRWQQAIDFYNGDATTRKIATYLIQKTQREDKEEHEERQKVTEPMLLFPTAVDGLCGIMISKEDSTVRDYGNLGDPDDANSTAFYLSKDADGEGMDWVSLFKMSSIDLAVTHRIWGIVDGLQEKVYNEGTQSEVREKTGEATVHVLQPTSVINWFPDSGPLEAVLVKERYDSRQSIHDPFPLDDVYVLYTLDGWERFRIVEAKNDRGEAESRPEIINSGEYEFWRTKNKRERILPIFKIEVPMRRPVGYLLSEKERAVWNTQSVRDFAIRKFSFALFRLMVNDEDEWKLIKKALEKGGSIVPQYAKEGHPHDFMSPDSSWLSEAGEILKKKIEDYFHAAFKEYGDAARQRTATEIRLESQTGIEAFLALLVDAVDEFENQAFWRVEQIYYPDDPGSWGLANVKRSRDFRPEDTDKAFEQMLDRVFGERDTIPFPVETIREAVEKSAEQFGLSIPENVDLDDVIAQSLGMIPENQMGG